MGKTESDVKVLSRNILGRGQSKFPKWSQRGKRGSAGGGRGCWGLIGMWGGGQTLWDQEGRLGWLCGLGHMRKPAAPAAHLACMCVKGAEGCSFDQARGHPLTG
jgi:hypothetical protein